MTVTSRRLRRGLDLLGQGARGRGVALADVGGQDEDAAGPGCPAPVAFAMAALHM